MDLATFSGAIVFHHDSRVELAVSLRLTNITAITHLVQVVKQRVADVKQLTRDNFSFHEALLSKSLSFYGFKLFHCRILSLNLSLLLVRFLLDFFWVYQSILLQQTQIGIVLKVSDEGCLLFDDSAQSLCLLLHFIEVHRIVTFKAFFVVSLFPHGR